MTFFIFVYFIYYFVSVNGIIIIIYFFIFTPSELNFEFSLTIKSLTAHTGLFIHRSAVATHRASHPNDVWEDRWAIRGDGEAAKM